MSGIGAKPWRLLVLLFVLVGCEEEPIQVGSTEGTGAAGPSGQPGQAPAGAATPADAADPAVAAYRDDDFVEADSNRDPFRNYAATFRPQADQMGEIERDIIMPDTGVDEMRLIGIVSGVANPRAMLVDRQGAGHAVRRGQYIGRSEVVQAAGAEELPVTLNWRVDRIRGHEIVLTREDPTAPNQPPLTRVIPLREESEQAAVDRIRESAER